MDASALSSSSIPDIQTSVIPDEIHPNLPELYPAPHQAQIQRLPSVLENIASQPDEHLLERPDLISFSPATSHVGLPLHPEQIETTIEGMETPENSKPLNVADALSYLDAVKKQFEDQPDVYNNFLDIMKDFKCEVIDTPGVIERVSTLFHGHSDLIQGFNTFLPPGYRIECSRDPLESNMITVTTPLGTTMQSTESGIHYPSSLQESLLPTSPTPIIQPLAISSTIGNEISRPETPVAASTSPMPYGTSSAATWLGGLGNKGVPERQGQGPAGAEEFHHAIQYVNKIKTRFEDDTDTYKQFLDILHAFRKEQSHEDSQVYGQVYAQVQVLFKDAPDLLAEFQAFLPITGGGLAGAPGSPASFNDVAWSEAVEKKGGKGESSAPKRKKRPAEKEIAPAHPAASAPKSNASRKKTKHTHAKPDAAPPASPSYHPYSRPQSPSHGQAHAHSHVASHIHGHAHSHQVQHLRGSVPQAAAGAPLSGAPGPQDELAFFDRAKKALESRETYDEFLKLLNLFSKEIIDARALIQRAEVFLGDGELYSQFKDLMGWDDKREGDNEGPPGSIRNWAVDWAAKPGSEKEERYGKSYRRLPLAETKLACSGRDELCWDVLNDVWVSHPTWASEESGFVSHKKNSYEEALHKSEEERHEFQFYIDIITRTIAIMQPLYDRIQEMSAEERHAFRLPPDFGGSSKSIYHRAVKKVYGRDQAGMEVLQALQDSPAVAIPVVLPRLKQKNEEWRRAQREWNRVWREVDARNFYKSLDHLGITFKANDKKYITTKSFVTEIESAKVEVAERAARAKAKTKSKTVQPVQPDPPLQESKDNKESTKEDKPVTINDTEYAPHLEYSFDDLSVLQDALKLVFSFLDRSTIQYSVQERRSVERMLRTFVPLFCMLPAAEFDSVFGPPLDGGEGTENEDIGHDDLMMGGATSAEEGDDVHLTPGGAHSKANNKSGGTSGRRSAGGGGSNGGTASAGGSHGPHGGIHPNDLRKKLLKTAQEKATKARSGSASASRAVSPTGSDDEHGKQHGQHGHGHGPSHGHGTASPTSKRKKGGSSAGGGGRSKEAQEVQRVEWEAWARLMPVSQDDQSMCVDVDAEDGPRARLARDGMIDEKPFFANTTFYALLRLLQLLYSRLLLCKEIAQKLTAKDRKSSVFTINPVAEELGLVDSHGPGAVLALAANVPIHPSTISTVLAASSTSENMLEPAANSGASLSLRHEGGDGDVQMSSETAMNGRGSFSGPDGVAEARAPLPATEQSQVVTDGEQTSLQEQAPPIQAGVNEEPQTDRAEAHFYGYLLDACEKLFEGDLDQTTFEENMRFLFGTKAYNVFTLDKLIAALVKQVQTAVVDSKCQELVGLLAKARSHTHGQAEGRGMSVRDAVLYRREAEQYLGPDDHLYRIDWVSEGEGKYRLRLWLVGSGDGSVQAVGEEVGRWRAYMESYVLSSGTEVVDEGLRSRMRRTFLQRTREESDEEGGYTMEGMMEVGVRRGTYKLMYRDGSEQIVWRERARK